MIWVKQISKEIRANPCHSREIKMTSQIVIVFVIVIVDIVPFVG